MDTRKKNGSFVPGGAGACLAALIPSAFILLALCWTIAATAAPGAPIKNDGTVSLMVSLANHDVDRLKAVTDGWLKDYKNGTIDGDTFIDRLGSILPSNIDGEWQGHLEAWLRKYPDSYPANYLLGQFYVKNAWRLRGGNFAEQTSEQQFADFAKYLRLADTQLEKSLKLYAKPIPSYCELIEVAFTLENGRQREHYLSAEKIDPQTYCTKDIVLRYLAPRWGGSIEQIDAFVAEVKAGPMGADKQRLLQAAAMVIKAQDAERLLQYRQAADLYRQAFYANPHPDFVQRLVWAADDARQAGDTDHAMTWYGDAIAINPKNIVAREQRGLLFENLKKDNKAALSDYQVAAEANSSWAQNRIGWWYMTGNTVEKNYATAEKYFNKAAAQGNETAKANLVELAKLRAKGKS